LSYEGMFWQAGKAGTLSVKLRAHY